MREIRSSCNLEIGKTVLTTETRRHGENQEIQNDVFNFMFDVCRFEIFQPSFVFLRVLCG